MPPLARYLVLLCLAALPIRPARAEWKIETVAGTGNSDDNGREGPAAEININQPFGVEFGPDGALYICEVGHHRVRRLDLNIRRLTTIAGSGRKGYAGDGGPAKDADLNEPYEVRFDHRGDLYFVEMRNCVVRRVERQTGRISTVAGTGQAGFGGDGAPATKALLRDPHSIAFDDRDHLFIADIGNHRIRRVDPQTGLIETIAGNGGKQLPKDGTRAAGQPILGPRALFVAGHDLWVALREGNSLWQLDLNDGTLHHKAGTGAKGFSGDGGPALKATFDGPKGIAVASDAVVVVDSENHAIRVVDIANGKIETIAGGGLGARGFLGDRGAASEVRFDRPHGICIGPDFSIYVGDTNNHRVRRIFNTDRTQAKNAQ